MKKAKPGKSMPNNNEPLTQRIIIALSLGSRIPQNDTERRVMADIKEAESKGMMLDLPFE